MPESVRHALFLKEEIPAESKRHGMSREFIWNTWTDAILHHEYVLPLLVLRQEIAKMSTDRSEESKQSEQKGGSLERWQGPYWWKSLKESKNLGADHIGGKFDMFETLLVSLTT